jgi:hypothetical protein
MMQLVAKKRVKYPHGPTGKEYAPGETFDALSERDAKALVIVGKAEYGKPTNKTDLPADVMKPKKVEEAPVEPETPLRYQRRDMRAADGPIGEEISALSSRRGRQPKRLTSDD